MNNTDLILQWQRIWADNSDCYDINRGILSFAKELFPDTIKDYYGTPKVHMELCKEFLLLYDPAKRFQPERQLQEIVWRGASKSTLSNFIWICYVCCYNGKDIILPGGIKTVIKEDMIVLASETNTLATNWTMRVRSAISSNRKLIQVFGKMKPEMLRDDEGRWRADSFTVRRRYLPAPYTGKNVTILSRGVGQQIRGINIDGRITLAIADDIYSKNNIKTPESRQNVSYWYNAELKNSIDLNEGKIVCIGTIVHEDTVVVANSKSRDYKTVNYPVMPLDKFNYVLSNYCQVDRDLRICEIPNSGECERLEKEGYATEWPGRFPLELMLLKFRESIEYKAEMTESMFWQEYFHITLSEADKAIKQDMFRIKQFELVCAKVKNVWTPFVFIDGEYRNVTTAIGIDSASSFKAGRDSTAIIWIAKDYHNRIYVYKTQSGRYGVSDEFSDQYTDKYLNTLCTDRAHIVRIGTSDEVFRWVDGSEHKPKIVVEVHNLGSEITRQIYRKMRMYGKPLICVEVAQTTNKEERIIDAVTPYYQARMVYHNPGQHNLMQQLEFLGTTKHDDEADILATTVVNLIKPHEKIEWNGETKVEKVSQPFKFPSWLKPKTPVSNWRTS